MRRDHRPQEPHHPDTILCRWRVRRQPGHWHDSPELRPDLRSRRALPDSYARLWFIDPLTESWANLVHQPHTHTCPVHQAGPRNLWDEIEAAYHGWHNAGRPGPRRWRITITPEGQQITLTPNHGEDETH